VKHSSCCVCRRQPRRRSRGKEAGQALTSDKQNVDIYVQQPGKLEVWEKKGEALAGSAAWLLTIHTDCTCPCRLLGLLRTAGSCWIFS
jgi:hypothetical protein